MENGQVMFLWVGPGVSATDISSIWGVNSSMEISDGPIPEKDSEINSTLRQLINTINTQRGRKLKIHIIRVGHPDAKPLEGKLRRYMVSIIIFLIQKIKVIKKQSKKYFFLTKIFLIVLKVFILNMAPFFRRIGLLYKSWARKLFFFKRRASYHFKASEFRNLRAFKFFQLLNTDIFKGILKNRFFIDVSSRCLQHFNCLIGISNIDNLVFFKFSNSKVDLKENVINEILF